MSHNSPILREQTVNIQHDVDDDSERMTYKHTHPEIESKSGCEQINLVTFFIFIFITFIMRFPPQPALDTTAIIIHNIGLNEAAGKQKFL